MARPRTDTFYVNRIAEMTELGLKPPAIALNLQSMADRQNWKKPPPSERTVRRIQQEHLGTDTEQRRQYRPFRWPDSVDASEIPWEASPIVLDLLRREDQIPTVGFVKWYWRVHLAAPDLKFADKMLAAEGLNERTLYQQLDDVRMRAIETYLAFAPWRETDKEKQDQTLAELFDANEITEESRQLFQDFVNLTTGQVSLMGFMQAVESSFDEKQFSPEIWRAPKNQFDQQDGDSDGR